MTAVVVILTGGFIIGGFAGSGGTIAAPESRPVVTGLVFSVLPAAFFLCACTKFDHPED